MEIHFAPTFLPSLKKMMRHETWWYKTYKFFRYDILKFFRNIWRFRRELYAFRAWDFHFNLRLLKRSLILTADYLETHGYETSSSRYLKIRKIRQCIELIDHFIKDDFINQAEKELGYELPHLELEFKDKTSQLIDNRSEEEKEKSNNILKRSREIEESQWKELWNIIHGQNHDDYRALLEELKINNADHEKIAGLWDEWFDGSGALGWWD